MARIVLEVGTIEPNSTESTAVAPSSGSDRAVLTGRIIAQLRGAMRELRCMSGDRLRRTEIGFTNVHVLSVLEGHGAMSMGHLAEILDVSLSNASGLIDRLEDRGLVERVRVPDDRRVVLVQTTAEGRAALARADVLKDELLQSILARLDEPRLARVAAALEDVTASAVEVFASDPELSRHEHLLDGHRQPTNHESTPVSASPA